MRPNGDSIAGANAVFLEQSDVSARGTRELRIGPGLVIDDERKTGVGARKPREKIGHREPIPAMTALVSGSAAPLKGAKRGSEVCGGREKCDTGFRGTGRLA